ncbi:CXADR-like membrane protein [Hypomesus transpacificus]|uniref:CXADR-like membrane protein n=1 Tax=Hypomesus transpacificus TaxID=137520 RepID=UPI001F081310|nr:CXADR-like membrane protein [Hypomesus transpacificus]XP_046882491.1 CXADR-like membrane protein [Hypomesus transpacificus]
MWFSVCLVNLFLLTGSEGCTLSGQENIPIDTTVSSGQSVLLPCSCIDLQTTPASFTWEVNKKPTSAWKPVTQSDLYRERMELFNETTPGNLSLLLSHLTEKDQGFYRCRIQSGQLRDIHLTVRACTLPGTRQDIVKSPGQSVHLLCSCTEPHTRPVSLKWEFSASGFGPWVPVTQSDLYRDRVEFNETTLLLSHLTKKDNGFYRCSMENGQFRDFHLSVQGENTGGASKYTPPPSDLLISIYVGLPLILIITGVAVCLYMKNKGRKTLMDEDSESKTGGERKEDDQSVNHTTTHNGSDTRMATPHTAKEDILTYSTIVHMEGGRRAAGSMMDQKGDTEYATVKMGTTS